MMKPARTIIGGLALAATVAYAGPPVVTVVGQADPGVDRQNVQDAIDAAEPGTTIELVGTFLLDGERIFLTTSRLTLTGATVDDDGDGAVNEDWADGVDNDGDGALDEDDWDAVLQGLANPDGTPVDDGALDYYRNRALGIEGITGQAVHVTVRHLKFSTFDRAINVFPDWFPGTKRCADYVPTGGSLNHLTIEHNWFDYNVRGIGVHGAVRNLRLRNNRFTDGLNGGVLIFGEEYGCINDAGGDDPVPMGTPRQSVLADNVFASDVAWGILSYVSEGTTIRDNTFEGGLYGIYCSGDRHSLVTRNALRDVVYGVLVEGGEKVSVLGNDVSGGFLGLYGALPSPCSHFVHNAVATAYVGLYLELGASGFAAVNNDFSASGLVDVFLDPSTAGNTVISTHGVTTVIDLGVDNRLIGQIERVE